MAPHNSPHVIHSHAHETDTPGTVYLKAAEGDDTAYGQALYPVPSADLNDPLLWPQGKKYAILTCCALYSFLGNAALQGPAVYLGILSELFTIDPATASNLINYANLAYGFGSLVWVPCYMKFGRRPVMLLSLLCFVLGLVGCCVANSYGGLMAARIISSFGSGVCEAIPVQLVNDIFFLHERGSRLGFYTVALCIGATGPLYAGYMLNAGLGYKLFFYVCTAFAGALLIVSFFVVEESTYHRVLPAIIEESDLDHRATATDLDKQLTTHTSELAPRKSFTQQLKLFQKVDHSVDYWKTTFRPFTYLLVPAVLWVILVYGLLIGLGAFGLNFAFPLLIVAPPYNWSQINSGLLSIATIVGYVLAFPLTPLSDRLCAWSTRRNHMIREAEMRLPILFIPTILAPVSMIVFGLTGQYQLHWMGYMVGAALLAFVSYFFFTNVLAYAMDSYNANVAEMLVIMNIGKQSISFGLGFGVLNWILQDGYAIVIAAAFGTTLFIICALCFLFYFWGKPLRRFTSRGALARMHARSKGSAPMVH